MYIKDSTEFVAFVTSLKLSDEVLVSFDVVSLFTSIPVDLALTVARCYLLNDDNLESRTMLSVDELMSLLHYA